MSGVTSPPGFHAIVPAGKEQIRFDRDKVFDGGILGRQLGDVAAQRIKLRAGLVPAGDAGQADDLVLQPSAKAMSVMFMSCTTNSFWLRYRRPAVHRSCRQ